MARAMVVDDSRCVRTLLSRTLCELGYEVMEASDGQEALETLEKSAVPFDLVLTDWNMPRMNGLELLRAIRSHARFRSLPVIMVTTETETPQMTTALEAGANEYILKPFTPEIVADKLRLAALSAT